MICNILWTYCCKRTAQDHYYGIHEWHSCPCYMCISCYVLSTGVMTTSHVVLWSHRLSLWMHHITLTFIIDVASYPGPTCKERDETTYACAEFTWNVKKPLFFLLATLYTTTRLAHTNIYIYMYTQIYLLLV